MASRYVGQCGRYAGQLLDRLAHIQTYEVAMQASQAVIHNPSRSLCVHPSRYIPSGACFTCFPVLDLSPLIWAAQTEPVRLPNRFATRSASGAIQGPLEVVYGPG